MTTDESVNGASAEASGSVEPSVTPERSSVGKMRGGGDPRALARLSVEARRAKKQAALDGHATPHPHRSPARGGAGPTPDGNTGGAPTDEAHGRPASGSVLSLLSAAELARADEDVLRQISRESTSETARVAALKELRSRQQPVEPEPEPVRRVPETANVGLRRLDPAGFLALGVAYGSTPAGTIASVEVLEEALVHARASSGHVRQAGLIADRLKELGRVVERPELGQGMDIAKAHGESDSQRQRMDQVSPTKDRRRRRGRS